MADYADKIDDEGKRKLGVLVRLTQRMQSLIESLLRFSRVGRDPLALTLVDPNVVVAEAREALIMLVGETDAEITVPRPLPAVRVDRDRFQEVIENLIANGLHYNDSPTRRVEVGWVEPAAPGAPPRFYVKDNGIGIPARHHEVIFRIFKRLHAEGRYCGGTGAGLTITRKIVELHGGKIWVESAEGQGSTFWFTLAPEAAS
jgi:light-regulated signal transduction histidine kinase (bacteriophytochrome)